MPSPVSEVRVTKNCALCRAELHLVQDSSGSEWYHASTAAQWKCWTEHRAEIEQGAEL